MGTPTLYDITDPEQLEALASPARQEIVDTVIALGRCSIREIAEALGRPADGLYYHIRALVQVGLLVEASSRTTGQREEALYAAPTRGIMRLRYRPEDAEHSAAVRRIVSGMLRSAERDFGAGLDPAIARCAGGRRNITASRQKAWLGREELGEVNALLARLQQILQDATPEDGGDLVSLTCVLAPIEPAPVRRGG